MTDLFTAANNYFNSHQPEFMFGMLVGFPAFLVVLCWFDNLTSDK